MYRNKVLEKFEEALQAVLPIMAIVLLLSFTIAPIPSSILLAFLFGGLLLVVGMTFFSLGAEIAMEPMGEYMGGSITKTRNLWIILPFCFALGMMITISEPDLQVLANQVLSVPNAVLILSVAAGVGFFLVIALLRMLFKVPLRNMLVLFYAITFVLAFLAPDYFMSVAFDSGGVTTGPMTVPFIMSFGLGITYIRSDKHAEDDSFGLVALCSIGPIMAVLILSMIYRPDNVEYTPVVIPSIEDTRDLSFIFLRSYPTYLKDIAAALIPIVVLFLVFDLVRLRVNRNELLKILIGCFYTYFGLVTFLTGVSAGFMPAGSFLGTRIASLRFSWIIIPIGMLIGYYIVKAEPAVYVLMEKVEEITDGSISGRSLQISLSIGMAVSIGLAMVRVLTGLNIMWFLVPGYLISLIMAFMTPKIFTAIAFDSGGVASGPMTATFLLPFAMGACMAVGGNVVTDAFGLVAMVAMTPMISIQTLGFVYERIAVRQGTTAERKSKISPIAATTNHMNLTEKEKYSVIQL